MKQELEIAINAWYKQWCELHDPFEDDFEGEVEMVLPGVKITYDIHNCNYIVL